MFRRSRPVPIISLLAVLLAVLLAATACTSSVDDGPSSSPSSIATTTTPSPRPTPTITATVTATPSSSTAERTTSAPTSSGPSACTNRQLSVSTSALEGGMSHGGVTVVFTNTGRSTCTLIGYPGAAVVDASGKQIVQAKRTEGGYLGGCNCTPQTVTLRPGGVASSQVEGNNGGGDECLRGRALLITPPNTTRSTRVPFGSYSCGIQVHPTVVGRSSN